MMVILRVWSFLSVWWKATSKSVLECPAVSWKLYFYICSHLMWISCTGKGEEKRTRDLLVLRHSCF
jgi:hypothetical protein